MSEERLEIIKENVYMRSEIAKNSRLGIDTSLGEELELLKEIERLNNIINELEKFMYKDYREIDKFVSGERAISALNEINRINKKLKELKDSD